MHFSGSGVYTKYPPSFPTTLSHLISKICVSSVFQVDFIQSIAYGLAGDLGDKPAVFPVY